MGQAAWALVDEAARRAGVAVAQLTELRDADRILRVVDRVWGGQLPPAEILRAMQHAGAVLYGADADGELVGFVWGFVGLADGLHLHSHMLGVVPKWQRRGAGYALKLAQRAACLDHGLEEVRWTYDPLVARNARFNLVRLGAEAHRFLPHFYGDMTDRLNRADRTDRFEVRWRLPAERVRRALAGKPLEPPPAGLPLVGVAGPQKGSEPESTGAAPEPGSTVAVPADYHALRAARPDLAARWRAVTAEQFQACFARGLVATWFDRDRGYVFETPEGAEGP